MNKLMLLTYILCMSLALHSQSVDEIIALNLKARGGEEKIRGLKTMVMECVSNRQGMEFPVKLSFANKVGFRLDMQIMGMDCFMLINEKAAYNYFPMRGQAKPEAMPEELHKGMIARLDIQGDFVDYKEKGANFKLLPEEKLDDQPCYVLLSTNKEGKEKTIYIDKKTNLVIKDISKTEVEGEEREVASTYSDFQTIDGYVLPMTLSSPINGDMKVSKYIINTALKPELFEVKD